MAESGGAGSQNATSMPPDAQEVGRVAVKEAHSLLQEGVMSSPAQEVGMRCPVADQPGQVWNCE